MSWEFSGLLFYWQLSSIISGAWFIAHLQAFSAITRLKRQPLHLLKEKIIFLLIFLVFRDICTISLTTPLQIICWALDCFLYFMVGLVDYSNPRQPKMILFNVNFGCVVNVWSILSLVMQHIYLHVFPTICLKIYV